MILADATPTQIGNWLQVFVWLAGGFGALLLSFNQLISLKRKLNGADLPERRVASNEERIRLLEDALKLCKVDAEECKSRIQKLEVTAATADKLNGKLDRITALLEKRGRHD